MSQWHQNQSLAPPLLAMRSHQPHTFFFALVVTVGLFGCRGSWNLSAPLRSEPSFDRLIELENASPGSGQDLSSAQQTRLSDRDSVHPQVAQRRPGGRTAASRHSESQSLPDVASPSSQSTDEFEAQETIGHSQVARRTISDTEDNDWPEETEQHTELLQQTQTAVKNRYRTDSPQPTLTSQPQSSMPSVKSQQARGGQPQAPVTSESVQSNSSTTDVNSGVVAIRLNDRKNVQQPESSNDSNESQSVVTAAAHQAKANENPLIVQPAIHNRYSDAQKSPADSSLEDHNDDHPRAELPWQEHLELAMKQLSDGVSTTDATSATTKEQTRQAVIKRLLALALGDRELMTSTVEGLQPHEQEYLKYQLNALMDAIDPNGNPVESRRWSLVMLHQRKAHEHLASLSNLEVNSLAFCTAVESFGVAERFPKYQFTPDQEVLLYCEVDNFVSEPSKDGKGFETQLQGNYEIVDSAGKRVADQSLPMDTHICRNIRRDYFIAYRVYMPQNISPGNYSLRLTLEDMKGRKFGQSEVAFQIQ